MNINLEYYKVFYYVAECKSFTKAADELFIAQPNVTRTIKMLEEQLGCVLFTRSKRTVELTPEGEKLFYRVKIAYDNILLGEEQLSADKSLRSGVVSVATSEIALYGLLLPILKRFRSEHKGVRLKVGNYSTRQSIAALNDGFSDFAVVTNPVDGNDKLKITELKKFKDVCVCGDAFKELAKNKMSIKNFINYPIVGLGKSSTTYDFYTAQFMRFGLKYAPEIEVATADQIMPMIKNDMGIGFVPEFFLDGQNEVNIVKIKEDFEQRSICFAERTDRLLSLAAEKLKAEILSFVGN